MKEHDIIITTRHIKERGQPAIPTESIGTIIHVHDQNPGRAQVEFLGGRIATVSLRDVRPEYTCVYCGCTDSRACAGGCSWVIIFQHGNAGVCSNCIAPHKPVQAIVKKKK